MEINNIVGKNLYPDGRLNRVELATLIFNNPGLLKSVNAIVHPVVFDHFRIWVLEQTAPYVIMEAAILFESGASKIVDKVATVVAPVEQKVERIIRRNELSREQVFERIRNQMDDEARIRKSDYIINNAENEMIIPVILNIIKTFLTLIKT